MAEPHHVTESSVLSLASKHRTFGGDRADSQSGFPHLQAPEGAQPNVVFDPCFCCDCEGRWSLIKCCRAIGICGVLFYSVLLTVAASLLGYDEDEAHLQAFYKKQFKPTSNFVQDLKLTYEGYRRTLQIQLGTGSFMLIGYSMLLIASKAKRERRRRELLCLGQPLATIGSISFQFILKIYFYLERDTGTIVNYFLLVDTYFSVCALALYKTLKAEKFQWEAIGDLEFPEYPPNRVGNLPLIYLTQPVKGPAVKVSRFPPRNSKDSSALTGESYATTSHNNASLPATDPPPYSQKLKPQKSKTKPGSHA